MDAFFIFISKLSIVQILIRTLIRISLVWSKYWGLLRFKALVPKSGIGSFYNPNVQVKYGKNIIVGNYVKIGGGCTLGALSNILIGNHVTISKNVTIETAGLEISNSLPYKHKSKPIIIEDGVWLASNVIILGGVTIGANSVVGAGVIVTKNIPPNTTIVGQQNRILDKKNKM